jgi:hypothetical protein
MSVDQNRDGAPEDDQRRAQQRNSFQGKLLPHFVSSWIND